MKSNGIYGAEAFEQEEFIDESLEVFDEGKEKQKEAAIAYFLISIVWAIGSSSSSKSLKEKFNTFFLDLSENLNKKYPK